MQRLERIARDVTSWLSMNQIGFALVGGLAVSLRTIERFTKDIDLAIAVDSDTKAEQYVRELLQQYFRLESILEHSKHSRIATVRLVKDDVLLDLLFASSGIENEVIASSTTAEIFEGLHLPVASLPGLLALKVLSVDPAKRPQDAVDIRNLLQESSMNDIRETVRLLNLISERGYNREKDLLAEFEYYQNLFRR